MKHGWVVFALMTGDSFSTDRFLGRVSFPDDMHGVLPVFRRKRDAERYARANGGGEVLQIKPKGGVGA